MNVLPEGRRAKEVAALAGVSRSAVSRAFNPGSYLDSSKRERILSVAKEIGYHPNMAARAMVSNRSHLVAVILPSLRHPWESQELDVLTESLQASGFATLVYKIPDSALQPNQLSHLQAYNPDSIIVYSDSLPLASVKALFARTRPIFPVYENGTSNMIDEKTDEDQGLDQLVIDQRPGIQQAINLLAGCGCQSLVWLSGPTQTRANQDRQRAVISCAEQVGIKVIAKIQGDFTYEQAREEVRAHFRTNPYADALFAANDVSAFGAMDALRHDLGLKIPEDINVIGFDNISQAGWKSYDLTTVCLDIDERVRALMRLIRNRLESPGDPMLLERVETRLIVRGTVG